MAYRPVLDERDLAPSHPVPGSSLIVFERRDGTLAANLRADGSPVERAP